jgi:porphobilinogen synthase
MMYPEVRLRRLRQSEKMRDLVNETALDPKGFVLPLFFDETISGPRTADSMPGVTTYPLKGYDGIASEIQDSGVNSVLLFGVPAKKDAVGSGAYAKDGVVQKAIEGLKECSDLLVISDLCLCEYTDHGHCGVLDCCGHVENDPTIDLYAKTAVSQADAGADIIAPSGMMDGQIAAIRQALDDANHKDVAIMAYIAKFYSAYYGPFRDVACSAPGKGNRAGYQMPCGNRKEAMREIEFDIAEGADIIMVKPAGPYLDIIRDAANTFDLPLAAYQVSGEYAMIKAAARNNWIDGDRVMMESLLGIKRAGADIIITYFAQEAARALRG